VKRDYKAFIWVNADLNSTCVTITVRAKSKKKARKKVLKKVMKGYVRISLGAK
jgi:hypothetical protein